MSCPPPQGLSVPKPIGKFAVASPLSPHDISPLSHDDLKARRKAGRLWLLLLSGFVVAVFAYTVFHLGPVVLSRPL